MRQTKTLLLKLQELDDRIDNLTAEKESIPEKKHELEESLEAHRAELEKAKAESVDLAKGRKELEMELEEGHTKIDRFKHQLYQVKTNREYEALQHEISVLEEKNSRLEDRILEIMENAEKASRKIADREKNLKNEVETERRRQAQLDADEKDLEDQIAIRNDERVRLVSDLDKGLLKRYDRIRASKGGLAVATVDSGACGGCFRRIPPHEMQNLKRDDRIITCEGCGRILIWRWE
jgi:predicted  nucleic acid-binding Zn-ribbon protein